jgi:glyoxylase-like metal-dependent hydrolase (beta-lactamase superfamily II)/8-oxo-dGTP pyrophosphatase MutT (NUDIX family)
VTGGGRNAPGAFDVFAGARKAASVIVLRDLESGQGLEVLMLRRADRDGDLRSGAAVFPGGVVDESDALAHRHVAGWDDARASARLRLASGGLDYLVAAARECFEEVGLLFARGADEYLLRRAHEEWRVPLQRGERTIADLCERLHLTLDLGDWVYFGHWLTPPGVDKRFDTRFFVARAPVGQAPQADLGEAVELMWLTPAQALDRGRGLKLLPVTRRTLENLARFARVEQAIEHALGQDHIPLSMPRLATSAKGTRIVLPDDHAWAEVGRIDPTGRADAYCDIVAGRAVRLSDRVWRITAPNAGVMTGPGTNTYLVGGPAVNRWTVIDPGPDDSAHQQALLRAAPGPIERILVTHTHPDHSPGAAALARATGAPVLGRRPLHSAGQDARFEPTEELTGGERFELGPAATLRVIHTPGHASNHLCYLLEEERLLFTGDHLMQGSTVVINPPDGDMAAYLESLRALPRLELEWLAPGHGFLVANPNEVITALIGHRLAREAMVLAALGSLQPAPVSALVQEVYADVPDALHPVAGRSLLAHLLKLEAEGRAARDGNLWRMPA